MLAVLAGGGGPGGGWDDFVDEPPHAPSAIVPAATVAAARAVRFVMAWVIPISPEEAYHWNFARHLDWSYYDHPPMLAWAIALGRLILGDTELGVRLLPVLFSIGTAVLLAGLARKRRARLRFLSKKARTRAPMSAARPCWPSAISILNPLRFSRLWVIASGIRTAA